MIQISILAIVFNAFEPPEGTSSQFAIVQESFILGQTPLQWSVWMRRSVSSVFLVIVSPTVSGTLSGTDGLALNSVGTFFDDQHRPGFLTAVTMPRTIRRADDMV